MIHPLLNQSKVVFSILQYYQAAEISSEEKQSNFVQDIDQAYIMDVGIKAALGYNPRSTMEWKGNRPSTRWVL